MERLYILIKLKDGREIKLEVYEYMGRIFSEGFGFNKCLKIKDGKVIYKLWEKEEYDTLEDFCKFLAEDFSNNEEDELKYYNTLIEIKDLDNVKEIVTEVEHYDEDMSEYDYVDKVIFR